MTYFELAKFALCFAIPAGYIGLLYLVIRHLPPPLDGLYKEIREELADDMAAAGPWYSVLSVIVLSGLGLAVLWN